MELSDDEETDGRTGDEIDAIDESGPDETRVVAQGTFDIVHPGHVHYLSEAADMGDELIAIVARRSNVEHKEKPICPATQRRDVVAAFEAVDHAILGHDSDIFVPIEKLDPDVIALGHDQHHDEDALADELDRRAIDCEIRRASGTEPGENELYSTRMIVDRILERRD